MTEGSSAAKCADCGLSYLDGGFQDLVIPNEAWRKISPTRDEGGLLCPTCLLRALDVAGIRCSGALMSGPVQSVSRDMMQVMRQVENIRERFDD